MNGVSLATSFTGEGKEEKAYNYLKAEGVLDFLKKDDSDSEQFPPEYLDLARLHKAVRARKVFTILEFGIGFSTIVLAHALMKNKIDWKNKETEVKFRNSNPFELHSIDASKEWIAITQEKIPEELKDIINLHYSGVTAGLFQSRSCHYYDNLPGVIPDFIYLDGPDPKDVKSNEAGDWSNPDTVVMAADILKMETVLLPGTCIAIDGRTSNAGFLKGHFYKNWDHCRSVEGDVTFFELQDTPLGKINESTLLYCLGDRVKLWKD